MMEKPANIDEYILAFPPEIQERLQGIRHCIKSAAPEATEVISYGMPAFKLKGIVAYFAAAKNHIGLYPTAEPIVVFREELAGYVTSKGAIQFPNIKPIPYPLIDKIIQFKVEQNFAKTVKKK